MTSEIAIPFRLDDMGRVARVATPDAAIRQHVMSLVNTAPSERVVLAEYGIPVIDGLFEEDDDTLTFELGERLQEAFDTWEPGIGLANLTANGQSPDDAVASIDVRYYRKDAPDTSEAVNSNIAFVRVGGHVDEIIRG